jgi:hypothetical protein
MCRIERNVEFRGLDKKPATADFYRRNAAEEGAVADCALTKA